MQKVYFKAVDSYTKTAEINSAAVEVLRAVIQHEPVTLESFVPLKVHCGEKGNKTYIEPKNFQGIIDYLQEQKIESTFMETNVLYHGERNTRTRHLKTAREHGFTQLPMIIADGEYGDEFEYVEINQKHFKQCKIGREIAKLKQLIILSHFKGHMAAGFGGAIKQLGMGCAAKGGKLDQHANAIPKISSFKCKACKACINHCPVKAIHLDKKAKIDPEKCIGCASCMGICPHNAISNSWLASLSKSFNERLAEYAYAAAKDKHNIYITFAFNITGGCDCEGHAMKPIAADIGVFAATDPVAIDQACLDMLDKKAGKKVFGRGRTTLEYGAKIGLGSREYELVELN